MRTTKYHNSRNIPVSNSGSVCQHTPKFNSNPTRPFKI